VLPLAAMVALAAGELVARRFGAGVPGAGPLVQHLTLWLGFLGAMVAAREGKILTLATSEYLPAGAVRRGFGIVAGAVGAGAAAVHETGTAKSTTRSTASILPITIPSS